MAGARLAPSPQRGSEAALWRRPDAALWRRWTAVTFLGEALGFLVPVLVVLAGADRVVEPGRTLLLVLAGVGEGAVLGAAQARVLTRRLPGFASGAWVLRTALAAGVAWAIGLTIGGLGERLAGWPLAAQLALAVPAGVVLLLSIGTAQWTVLRRSLPRAGRWVAWTAAAWLAGLALFMAVATPLWQPGQAAVLVALIGVLAGCLMAATMAAVTGWGLVRLLRQVGAGAGGR
jgi:Ca2+-transporting ATPase